MVARAVSKFFFFVFFFWGGGTKVSFGGGDTKNFKDQIKSLFIFIFVTFL